MYLVLDTFTTDDLGNPTGGNNSVNAAATDTMSSVQGTLPSGFARFIGIGLGAISMANLSMARISPTWPT